MRIREKMGHGNAQNLGIVTARQLYARGTVTINEIIAFCVKKLTPINAKLDKVAENLRNTNREFREASNALKFDEMKFLKQKIETLTLAEQCLREKKSQWCYNASEHNYDDEMMLSQGIEYNIQHFVENNWVEPILDTDDKKTWFNAMTNKDLDDDDLWEQFDTIGFRLTKPGYAAYRQKTLEYVGAIEN